MRTVLTILSTLLGVYLIACFTAKQTEVLEIYTELDIYYVDLDRKMITTETGEFKIFTSQNELVKYMIEETTRAVDSATYRYQ